MTLPRALTLLPLAGVLALGAAGAPSPLSFEVVKLPAGSARLRAGDANISLSAGSPAWAIPLETSVNVVSGGIWAQFGDATVKAWPGDSLRFHATGSGVQVEATAGKLLIERPDGSTRHLEPGQSFALPSAALPAPPSRPSAGGCVSPAKRAGP